MTKSKNIREYYEVFDFSPSKMEKRVRYELLRGSGGIQVRLQKNDLCLQRSGPGVLRGENITHTVGRKIHSVSVLAVA